MSKLTTDEIAKLGVIVEYANADAWRVIIAGQLVGFALRMSGGGWGAFDANDRRVTGQHFKRPLMVGKHFLAEIQSARSALSGEQPEVGE